MPPFLLPAMAAVAVAVAVAVLKLLNKVRDKSILVVGPRQAGKTTLRNAILDARVKDFVLDPKMTSKVTWEQRTFGSERLKVNVGDTPGGMDSLTESLTDLDPPDLLVFVVSADHLRRPEYLRHSERMAASAVNWSTSQRRALVVTHADIVLYHARPSLTDLDLIDIGDLGKLLDVESFLLTNLTLPESATFVVRRLIKELTR